MLEKDFSHVGNFTGYMDVVFQLVQKGPPSQRILDIPAGNGLLSDRLRAAGHQPVCADINRAKPDYIYADLSRSLPFKDGEFDMVLCLEGIEHIVDSVAFIREFCRLVKSGGRIVISLPNVQNVFSRFQFLCTGTFYQFTPWMGRQLQLGKAIDRGHISPLGYQQLRYLFACHGASLKSIKGDRWKKKWLIPLLIPFLLFGKIWMRRGLAKQTEDTTGESRQVIKDLASPPALFARSLVLTFEKNAATCADCVRHA
ncbi:MAG TPA: class I SAM-dependent methyltransferase [Verrucomicrobiae bacterium]